MPTLKDIAGMCGVSVATVSKVLNGHTDIGSETRAKVLRAVEESGYMANSAARTLRTNRTYNLGILFVDEQNSGLAHEYFSAVLDSFKRGAEQNGYDITFINRNVGKVSNTYLQHCMYRNLDGVVIACVDFSDPQVLELIESDIPVVTVDHVFDNRAAVVSDNVSGLSSLTEYIISMGHTKIAFIHGENTSVTRNRDIGFFRTMEKHGIPVPDEYIVQGAYHDARTTFHRTKELLESKNPPTCIIFPDDYSAIGGMNAIYEKGLTIPEDISIAGYDGIPLSRVLAPKLTTYVQDTESLGRLAAEKLIDLIEHPRTALVDRMVVSGKLQKGASVKQLV